MSIDGVKPGICLSAEAGKTVAEKISENRTKLLAATIAPGVLTAGIVADKWEKADENAKEGVKMAAVVGTLIATAAFLTGKANGLKGMKALTGGAKTLWAPIKKGFSTVKGELKTKLTNGATKIKANAKKLVTNGKEKISKLYSAAKKQAGKISEKIKNHSKKAAEA